MIRLFKFSVFMYLFWILLFLAGKLLFTLYQWPVSHVVPIGELIRAFGFGLKMDIAMASYCIMAIGIFSLSLYAGIRVFRLIMHVLTIVLVLIFSLIFVSDFEIYKNWLAHVDASVFQYFDSSFSAFASTGNLKLMMLIFTWILFAGFFIWIYFRFITTIIKSSISLRWFQPLILLLACAICYIPARGGIDVASMNTGSVYFSQNMTANHIAINPVWNFMYSFDRLSSLKNNYVYMTDKEATQIVDLYKEGADNTIPVLNTSRPNIVIIMMEGFESQITHSLGEYNNVTPCFDSLVHEGILFSNMYASGTRTDKGLVSILSGFPAQSVNPIIKFTRKIEKLPTLSKLLVNEGYSSLFIYGGNKQFTNMNSLIVAGGFEKVTDVADFDNSLRTFKWGVHDEYVYNTFSSQISRTKQPFIAYMITLSNHEPFDVPTKKEFKSENSDLLYLHAARYADSCLGHFIRNAQKQIWWKNTLVILVADHATIYPGNKPYTQLNRYQIPMLWLGGALMKKDTIVSNYCSQTDIPRTVLKQCGKDDKTFTYSRNILNRNNNGYALFCYNDGFGIISQSFCQIYDNTTNRYSTYKGHFNGIDSLIGKALWQQVNNDFVKK